MASIQKMKQKYEKHDGIISSVKAFTINSDMRHNDQEKKMLRGMGYDFKSNKFIVRKRHPSLPDVPYTKASLFAARKFKNVNLSNVNIKQIYGTASL